MNVQLTEMGGRDDLIRGSKIRIRLIDFAPMIASLKDSMRNISKTVSYPSAIFFNFS